MADEILISYETLFELLRLERSRTELQQLPTTYLSDVQKLLSTEILDLNTLSEEDQSKKNVHINNTVKIINEIYERREKKIINMAVDKSKTKSAIIDFSKFLDFEKDMFEEVLNMLDSRRKSFISAIPTKKKEAVIEPENTIEEPKQTIEERPKHIVIRFLSPMPSFLGPELDTYGPFEEEDVARLPTKMAQLLIDKKRAEEITQYS